VARGIPANTIHLTCQMHSNVRAGELKISSHHEAISAIVSGSAEHGYRPGAQGAETLAQHFKYRATCVLHEHHARNAHVVDGTPIQILHDAAGYNFHHYIP
jgi:hypothetical protein